MEFVKVLDKAELPTNTMVAVDVGGKKVLLANVDGSDHAIANRCTHTGGSLAEGVLERQRRHLPPPWRSIRRKNRQGGWQGQDRIRQDVGQE